MQKVQAHVEQLVDAAHKGEDVLLIVQAHYKVLVHLVRAASHHHTPAKVEVIK